MSATTVDLAAQYLFAAIGAMVLVGLFLDVVRDIWKGRS